MPRVHVDSEVMDYVAYRGGTLEVVFDSGHIYRYFHVPRRVYAGLIRADSKGRYFHHYIRNRYPFRRIG